MTLANKPRIFVSSTIRGFADLRSAVKYWLEEMGADVRMSEYVDFQREAEDGTYDSCFKAIVECDYYILLIGGDKGSEFKSGASVTQQEYRVAARLAKEGRIKPVIFIRKEVMTALTERQSLIDAGLEPDKLNTTKSRVLTNAEFVQAFVEEIKQTEYEREGTEGRAGAFWYYQFDTFRDIVDALRVNLHLNASIKRQALLANLSYELESNLTEMMRKFEPGSIIPIGSYLRDLRQTLVLDPSIDNITLTDGQATGLVFFQIHAWLIPDKLQTVALGEAILSGEFLIYDQENSKLRTSEVQVLMQKLLSRTERLQMTYSRNRSEDSVRDLDSKAFNHITEAHKQKQPTVIVPIRHVASVFLQCNLIEDITGLSIAILRYIQNPATPLQDPQLNPDTPYQSEVEKLSKERPTTEDIRQWVLSH